MDIDINAGAAILLVWLIVCLTALGFGVIAYKFKKLELETRVDEKCEGKEGI